MGAGPAGRCVRPRPPRDPGAEDQRSYLQHGQASRATPVGPSVLNGKAIQLICSVPLTFEEALVTHHSCRISYGKAQRAGGPCHTPAVQPGAPRSAGFCFAWRTVSLMLRGSGLCPQSRGKRLLYGQGSECSPLPHSAYRGGHAWIRGRKAHLTSEMA